MSGLRIGVLASLVTPLRAEPEGGVQTFVVTLARALRARGHDVILYAAEGSVTRDVPLRTLPVPAGVEAALWHADRPAAARVPGLRDAFAAAFARMAGDGRQVISQHAFDVEAFELAAGRPVVHTLHLPPAASPTTAAVLGSPGHFVTVSQAMGRAWRRAGLSRVRVIRNGVADVTVAPGAVEPRAVVAGRVSPEKGTATGLRVARALGLEPVLAGHVYDARYHREEVGAVPVRPLSQEALWELMARSAVTLVPSQWEEPFGLVAAEAQVVGCPVAAFRRGGLAEVVREGVGGALAPPGDEVGLVAAARRALALDRSQVRAAARRRLLIGPVAARYERVLAEVAGAKL